MYGAFPVPVGVGYRPGYLARPDRAGQYPTVVMIGGLEGVGSREKSVARRLARKGVAVVVVDCSRPTNGISIIDRYNLLTDSEALTVIDETARFLTSPDVDWSISDRLGLLGMDVGGRFALIGGAHRGWVGAVGVISTPLTGDEHRGFPVAGLLDHLPMPVLGLYGAADEAISSVDEAQNRNVGGTWLVYDSASHEFFDEGSVQYDEAAARDAFARLADFFRANLPAPLETTLG